MDYIPVFKIRDQPSDGLKIAPRVCRSQFNIPFTIFGGTAPLVAAWLVKITGNPLSITWYHVGQIVQVARIHAGDEWNTLTIPRGESEQFNKANWGEDGKSHS